MCASPRASHAIRTIMPPSASATYARGRDDAIWTTLQAMLGGMGDAEAAHARQVAALPGARGCLGLLSAEAIAPAAYWASWADALPACPASGPWCRGLAARLAVPRIADPYRAHSRLRASAFLAAQLARTAPLPGRAACRSVAHRCAVRQATSIPPQAMQIALRRRLRLPLPLFPGPLRPQPWMWWSHGPFRRPSGRPGRATAVAGPIEDRRRLDLVVYGATANGGALCCDATLVSPLTRTGHPDGAALKVAERRKHSTYPELARGGPQ